MPTKRTYGDRCGVARALDLVGERWALLVVRELLLGIDVGTSFCKAMVVDTDGDPLRRAVRAEPDVISPNVLEAEELVGHEFNDEEDHCIAVREMVEHSAFSWLPVSLILTQRFDTLAKIGE